LTDSPHSVFKPVRFLEAGRPQGAAELGGVLIHGRYRTPQEMVYFASRMGVDNIRWIAPSAGQDRTWYPGVFMAPLPSNEPFVTQAIRTIDHAVDRANESGRIDRRHLVMVGFSQGACLTAEYALRHPGRCSTLVIFTGGLFGPPGTVWQGTPEMLSGTRVLITGSDVDDWIPEARVHETASVLAGFGAEVTVRIYPGRAHEVSDAELTEAGAFIHDAQSHSDIR
jgi:phospholipase/carboxylesterase/glyoxalase family protein